MVGGRVGAAKEREREKLKYRKLFHAEKKKQKIQSNINYCRFDLENFSAASWLKPKTAKKTRNM